MLGSAGRPQQHITCLTAADVTTVAGAACISCSGPIWGPIAMLARTSDRISGSRAVGLATKRRI